MQNKVLDQRKGFTLIEVLVAMAIGGLLMAGIYRLYSSQQRHYLAQEQISCLQQRLRIAMHFMEKDIRLAGCDPTGNAHTGIQEVEANRIRITMDVTGGETDGLDNDGDGEIDEDDEDIFCDGAIDGEEDITYSHYSSGGIKKLGRKRVSGVKQPVAEHIDALNFAYLDGNGNPATVTSAVRSVQISLVARTERPDPRYTDTRSYRNQQGLEILPPQNDHFHRRMLTTQVECRNLTY